MLLWLMVQFVGGLLLLLAGGDALVRGSAPIARNLGVPPVVVGLTVVAFGNVVGASIVNISLILG